MKYRLFFILVALLGIFSLTTNAAYPLDKLPKRVELFIHGVPYPGKPITFRCMVESDMPLPEERVTATIGAESESVGQEIEMRFLKTEGKSRVYEYTIEPLPVGDFKIDCHLQFVIDDYEKSKQKFTNIEKLYVIDVQNRNGEDEIELSQGLYVHVRDDRILFFNAISEKNHKNERIRNILARQNTALKEEELKKMSLMELDNIDEKPKKSTRSLSSVTKVDNLLFYKNGAALPKKPIILQCRVWSQEMLPDEKVIITKEINNNEVEIEEEMKLAEVKPGERSYEYLAEALPVGDYKYTCHLHYTSDVRYYVKNIKVNQKENNHYEIEEMKSLYVVVRDDEVVISHNNFEYIEKDQLIRRIQKKFNDAEQYRFPTILEYSYEELEAIYGEPLTKYKAIGASRPK